jgi:DNA-binding HxlR family transcriptional regulator
MNSPLNSKPLEPHIGCIASTMEIIGNKWTALILRLDDLESHGIITRQSFAEVPPRCEYDLTEKGRDLIPVLKQMATWGTKYYQKGC